MTRAREKSTRSGPFNRQRLFPRMVVSCPRVWLCTTLRPKGDSAWSMFDAGIITQFAEPADHITFSWNAFAGYAK